MMDDILVHGVSQEEHDRRLHCVFQRLQAARVTLNKKKCVFSVPSVEPECGSRRSSPFA